MVNIIPVTKNTGLNQEYILHEYPLHAYNEANMMVNN